MEYILNFRLPNLYTIIIVTKIKKDFLKKKGRVKGFFIVMTMLSFKQVESNYGKKKPCERGCNRIIKFSQFEIWIPLIWHYYFFQFELKMAVHAAFTRKKICEVKSV